MEGEGGGEGILRKAGSWRGGTNVSLDLSVPQTSVQTEAPAIMCWGGGVNQG